VGSRGYSEIPEKQWREDWPTYMIVVNKSISSTHAARFRTGSPEKPVTYKKADGNNYIQQVISNKHT
jgi:hypothetical protein